MSALSEKICNLQTNVVNKRIKYKDTILKYEYQNNDIDVDILEKTKFICKTDRLSFDVPDVEFDEELVKILGQTNYVGDKKKITALEEQYKKIEKIVKQLKNERKSNLTKQIDAITHYC